MLLEIKYYRDNKNRKRKSWLRKCDLCGREDWLTEHYKAFQEKTHCCLGCAAKINGIKKLGKPTWNSKKYKPIEECKLGATYVEYVQIYIGRNLKRKNKYCPQHIKIMEDYLGRILIEGGIIHHLDGNKRNNKISNLLLCESKSQHRFMHRQLEVLAFELIKLGAIKFDTAKMQYYFTDDPNLIEFENLKRSLEQFWKDKEKVNASKISS